VGDREPGGTLALVGVAIDHAAPATFIPGDIARPEQLAALSRTLARNVPTIAVRVDPVESHRGRSLEGNTIIRVPDPAR